MTTTVDEAINNVTEGVKMYRGMVDSLSREVGQLKNKLAAAEKDLESSKHVNETIQSHLVEVEGELNELRYKTEQCKASHLWADYQSAIQENRNLRVLLEKANKERDEAQRLLKEADLNRQRLESKIMEQQCLLSPKTFDEQLRDAKMGGIVHDPGAQIPSFQVGQSAQAFKEFPKPTLPDMYDVSVGLTESATPNDYKLLSAIIKIVNYLKAQ